MFKLHGVKQSDTVDSDAALATLEEGIQWAETEHRLLREERTALESFDARLETIEPAAASQPSPGPGAIRTLGSTGGSGGERLAAVRDAYRETVMSVDHYEAEYGESFERHVHSEFGPDLAEALDHGSSLPPPVYRRLRTAVADAIESRERVLELLAAERDGLREVRAALGPARKKLEEVGVCPFEQWTTAALHAEYDRVQAFRDRCERLATERQCDRRKYVQDRSALPDRTVTEGYLYQPLDTSYPGLAALAVFADRFRTTAQELQIVLLRRDSLPTDHDGNRTTPPSVDSAM